MLNLALIIHNIRSTYNVGSILRSAECFGVTEILFSGYSPYPIYDNDERLPHIAQKIHNQIAKTSLGAEKLVPFSVYQTIEQAIDAVRNSGYNIAVLEQDKRSIPLESFVFNKPTAIIIGNELTGVEEWTKKQSDVILEIKQYGHKESLNVASATAIALFAAKRNT